MSRFSDCFFIVVGDEVVTQSDLQQMVASPSFEDPTPFLPADISPRELARERLMAAALQQTEAQLKIEGGQNQGFEPELIERALTGDMERQVIARGGPVKFGDYLASIGQDADSFRAILRTRLMSQIWTDSVTGRTEGATGRIYVDSYIRPSTLYRRYQADLATPDIQRAAEVGRQPAKVSIRRLIISSQLEGDEQKASDLAEACREFLLTGAGSFEDLVNQYAPEDNKGSGSRLNESEQDMSRLLQRFHPGPASADFLATAAPGDLSPVLMFSAGDGSSYFILYRFEGRSEAVEAFPFGDLELQQSLREAISNENRGRRITRGVSILARTTRVSDPAVREILIKGGGAR